MTVRSRSRFESNHRVGHQRVQGDVGASLAQFERASGGVRNHLELHALQLGRRRPIVGIAFDHHFFVHLRAHKAKWPGADGFAIKVIATAVRHDADRAVGEVPQHRRKRLLQMKNDGVVVGRVDVVDGGVGACFGAAEFAAEERIERPLDVARSQELPVVEVNSMMQMKNIGLRIGYFPTVSQPRLQVEVVVPADQRIEEQFVDSLRLRINSDPRIKIRRTALNDHDQRVGIGFVRATGEEQNHRDTEAQREFEP